MSSINNDLLKIEECSNKEKNCPTVSGIIKLSNKIAMSGEMEARENLKPLRLRSLSEEFSGFVKKSSAEPIIELNDKECDEKTE
jgi:hypothetical protein